MFHDLRRLQIQAGTPETVPTSSLPPSLRQLPASSLGRGADGDTTAGVGAASSSAASSGAHSARQVDVQPRFVLCLGGAEGHNQRTLTFAVCGRPAAVCGCLSRSDSLRARTTCCCRSSRSTTLHVPSSQVLLPRVRWVGGDELCLPLFRSTLAVVRCRFAWNCTRDRVHFPRVVWPY